MLIQHSLEWNVVYVNFLTDNEGNLHFIVVLAMKLNYKIWPFFLQRKAWLKLSNFWCLQVSDALHNFCSQWAELELLTSISTSQALHCFGIAAAVWTFSLPSSHRIWTCLVCFQIITNLLALLFCYRRWSLREGKNLPKELLDLLTVSVIHSWVLRGHWTVELVVARCPG